jgi:DNA-binding transcriptional LysR family regulator
VQLRSLKVFCDIAQQRSFSKAADENGLTQSAASQIVHQMEEHLGVRLIDRSKRPLVLTSAGQQYFAGVLPLVRQYVAVEEEVRTVGRQLAGRVRLAAIYSVGLSYLPDLKQRFMARYPEAEIRVEYAHPDRVYQLIESGVADLGLVSYPRETRVLRSEPWLVEPMRLVCAPTHRLASLSMVALEDLAGCELIGFDPGLRIRREIDRHLEELGLQLHVPMAFDNIDSLIRAILVNNGLGILPEPCLRSELASGSLKQLECPALNLQRTLGVVYRKGGELGRAARDFATEVLGRNIFPCAVPAAAKAAGARRKPVPAAT